LVYGHIVDYWRGAERIQDSLLSCTWWKI